MNTKSSSKKKSVRPIIMADIAARAGVAVSTVSRVINRSPLVAPAKRKEIEAIIASMGYEPSPLEKRKGIRKDPWPWIKHRMFKVVLYGQYDVFWITNYAPIYSYALHGIEVSLGDHQFRRLMDRAETPEALKTLLARGGTDGFLLLNTGHDPLPEVVNDYPVVTFMGAHDHLSCDRVMPDAEQAGTLAAEYLISKGCKYCVAVGGGGAIYRKRTRAFRETLAAAGIEAVEILDGSIERGGANMHQANRKTVSSRVRPLLTKAARPIGIFSVADIVTPVLYAEMNEAGFKIGKNLHVVSCNNERPYLDPLHPEPAVIDIQAEYIGRRAVHQLLRRLEKPDAPHEKILIEPKLIHPDTH